MPIATRLTRRSIALAAATALVLALAATAPVSASAAASEEPCGKQVFLDWWDNYRIDRIYPLHCYRDAIKVLPVDIRQYSRAEDDILRALAYALQDEPDPGDDGSAADEDRSGGNGQVPGAGNSSGTDEGRGGGNRNSPGSSPASSTPAPVDTSGPAAVPLPLIVLASIAGLLLMLGGAGYVKRRVTERLPDDPPPV